ncbi:MAG TPA: hypothetical protein VF064_18970 [Pyrinomonadaceae bacterium]
MKQVERQRTDAVVIAAKARTAEEDALKQKGLAEQSEKDARTAQDEALEQKRIADEAKALAEEEARLANASEARATDALSLAEKARQRAIAAERLSNQLLYAADSNLAQHLTDKGRFARARGVLDELRPAPGEDDLRGFEWYYLHRLSGVEGAQLEGHQKTVNTVAISPTGGVLATGSYDGTVKLWAVSTGREVATLRGHTREIFSVAFGRNEQGSFLATEGWDGKIGLWYAPQDEEVAAPRRRPEEK